MCDPTHDEIAKLAFELWVSEGRPEGKALPTWLFAEAMLRARLTPQREGDNLRATKRSAGEPK